MGSSTCAPDDCETKKCKDHECDDCDSEIVKEGVDGETNRIIVFSCIAVMLSYASGLFGITCTIPVMCCGYILWLIKDKVGIMDKSLSDDNVRREHTRRALEHPNSETVEWLNTLLNRWWCFGDEAIGILMKRALDPILESSKPNIIESIELSKFTLGCRTPYLSRLQIHDISEDLAFKQMATDITCRNPPSDMASRVKYQIAIDADMGLKAPDSQLCISLKLKGKLGNTDIVVNEFKLRGRLQIVLFFNQNIAFPHLTAFSFSFLTVPKVKFGVKLLKSIKLMEFSSIRSWIEELVNDILETSLVEPGQVTIPLCSDPGILGRKSGYACGVLRLTIRPGSDQGTATNDTEWCSITLDNLKIRTKERNSSKKWKQEISLLIRSLAFDKVKIKIKARKMLGPSYTVVQYLVPLLRLNLEKNPQQEMPLEDKKIRGSDLQVSMTYSALPVLELSNETDEKVFQTIYVDEIAKNQPDEVAGVLLVRVHKGVGLIPMDPSGKSDPYVTIFANSERLHIGHVIKETLNPEWDALIEFCTLDYTQTTLSFIVYDSDASTLAHVLSSREEDDFMGSCSMALTKKDSCVYKRCIDLKYKIHGDSRKGINEQMKKVGHLEVSVVFRPVPMIKASINTELKRNVGMPEGEPLFQKHTKIDANTVEMMLRSERGSLTISIARARNLIALDANGRSDPFVSVRVGNSKQEKYKSQVKPRTLNPVWNEEVTLALLQEHEKLSIEVFDKDAFTQERMGYVRLDYKQVMALGGGEKQWFPLTDAKSGEIQLGFKIVNATAPAGGEKLVTIKGTAASGSEDSSDEDFLVYDDDMQTRRTSSSVEVNASTEIPNS